MNSVARIDDKIEQELLNLTDIGPHIAERSLERFPQRDASADGLHQHLLRVFHHGVKTKHDRLGRLGTAEPEKLFAQRARALGRAQNFRDRAAITLVFGELLEQEHPVSHDRRQDIIEVVSNAAGNLSERFHFLRLQELRARALERFSRLTVLGDFSAKHRVRFLQLNRPLLHVPFQFVMRIAQNLFGALALGDIRGNAADRISHALRVAQGELDRKKDMLSIRLRRDFLELKRDLTVQGREIVRSVDIGEFSREHGMHIAPEDGESVHPEQFFERRIGHDEAALQVLHEHDR